MDILDKNQNLHLMVESTKDLFFSKPLLVYYLAVYLHPPKKGDFYYLSKNKSTNLSYVCNCRDSRAAI